MAGTVALLRNWPQWETSIEKLRRVWEEHGEAARTQASTHAELYAGRRPAMVFDVVMSRRRQYETAVLPMVAAFQETPAARSLSDLAEADLGTAFPFSGQEADTITSTATGLLRFGEEQRCAGDDQTAEEWAQATGVVELSPKLDPYVGKTHGLGIALFAYLRMRCGADALKPDSRIRAGLEQLGFPRCHSDEALLMLAGAAADEIGATRLELDQLLWFSGAR